MVTLSPILPVSSTPRPGNYIGYSMRPLVPLLSREWGIGNFN